MLSDVLIYAGTLLWGSLTVMSGALAAIVYFYERVIKKRELQLRPYLLILAGFVLIAGFLAWRNEHRTLTETQTLLAKTQDALTEEQTKRVPRLAAAIADMDFGDLPPEDGGPGTFLVLTMGVINTGAPSIVDAFDLTITLPSGRVLPTTSPVYHEQMMMLQGKETQKIVYGSDTLFNKTSDKPLATGARISGILPYHLPGIPSAEVNRDGTLLTVVFYDVFHNPFHTTSKVIPKTERSVSPYVPGVSSKVVPAPSPSR